VDHLNVVDSLGVISSLSVVDSLGVVDSFSVVGSLSVVDGLGIIDGFSIVDSSGLPRCAPSLVPNGAVTELAPSSSASSDVGIASGLVFGGNVI
jgi:hypothetical protein